MPVGEGLLNPTMILFSGLIKDLLPQVNRDSINVNNDDTYFEALEAQQRKNDKGKDTQKVSPIFITGATLAV